ncbi:MAG: glycosyltransferase family 2 protein [Clostridia bacterium]|nr:glycosyltransferase family 2 protein [Clostridia bacterium]
MPLLTVFTPTYNRAYILPQCYRSMCRQTCKDFIWLVVDDGSTDGTRELVESWMRADNGFELRYVYQENQGMHGAHNLAYENIDTELNTCIDSDDYMPDDAVEKITRFWQTCERDGTVGGFLALDTDKDGNVIGTRLPENVPRATSYEVYYKYGVTGDKKFILRSDLTRLYPYPVFEGEKYVNLATKYSLLDRDYTLLLLNEPVCIVEYMPDGSSLNMIRQYFRNPRGFAYSRKLCMQLPYADFKFRFVQAMHYVSSCLILRDRRWLADSPRKALTLLAAPAGILWYLHIRRQYRHLKQKED